MKQMSHLSSEDATATADRALKKSKLAAALRATGIVALIIIIIAAISASLNQKVPNSDRVWDPAMTIGSMDAENYFIIYSDIACPYCLAFENAIIENEESFEKYIENNDILLEVRLSDFLYEYGEHNPQSSRDSALAIYCARDAGRFWDYYNLTVTTVWNEFFRYDGKSGVTRMDALDTNYWLSLGHSIGLGTDFDDCVTSQAPLAEIESRALKSAKTANGLPYFKFNSYILSGFDLSWGWDYVQMYFDAGLKSK